MAPQSTQSSDYLVHYTCITNISATTHPCVSEITLKNASRTTLNDFTLFFSSMRVPVPVTPDQINGLYDIEPRTRRPEWKNALKASHVNGDLCRIEPVDKGSFNLPPGESTVIRFPCSFATISIADAPTGYFLAFDDERVVDLGNGQTGAFSRPEQLQRGTRDSLPSVTPEIQYGINEKEGGVKMDALQVCPVTPRPKSWRYLDGAAFVVYTDTVTAFSKSLENEADYLAEMLGKMIGRGKLRTMSLGSAPDGSIRLELKSDSGISVEGYQLSVASSGIHIACSTPAGCSRGLTTLLQLVSLDNLSIPAISISDSPRFGYRGLHIDISRNFHPLSTLKRVVDLISLYKMNVLHLHFSDDEGWRLEIPGLPELTTFGAVRSHGGSSLPPAQGSGALPVAPGSGHLTREEFIELLRFARRRHVRVVPEIEMPGHARAAIKAMEHRARLAGSKEDAERFLLSHEGDESVYSGAQAFNDNVLCIALSGPLNFVRHVFGEVKRMYEDAGVPLDVVHVGGDEVAHGAWERCPLVNGVLEKRGITLRQLRDEFWADVIKAANELGIGQVGGWEEIALVESLDDRGRPTRSLSTALLESGQPPITYIWNTIPGSSTADIGYKLANTGYPIVMSPGPRTYFDFAYDKQPEEPGLYWGGFISLQEAWDWDPVDMFARPAERGLFGNPLKPELTERLERLTEKGRANVLGVQAQLWAELVRSRERLEFMLGPRLLATAERGWSDYEPGRWTEFAQRIGTQELKRLDNFGLYRTENDDKVWGYRVPVPGAVIRHGKLFANADVPIEIRHTFENRAVVVADPSYQGPVALLDDVRRIRLACFTGSGRKGREVCVEVELGDGDSMQADSKSEMARTANL